MPSYERSLLVCHEQENADIIQVEIDEMLGFYPKENIGVRDQAWDMSVHVSIHVWRGWHHLPCVT